MNLRETFQSIIALHQQELPYALHPRDLSLPLDSGNIITISGVRRCGKSSLLNIAANSLIKNGVPKERILNIGFDDERFSEMTAADFNEILEAYREMYPEIPLEDVYMFFDEIQLVKGWELFILRTYKNYCKHIFITGSTAEMLSGEMASALRGWPDEYTEYPLSFSEYLDFKDIHANRYTEEGIAIIRSAFKAYCKEGGYPKAVLTNDESERTRLLQSYFNTMLFRDMIEYHSIQSSPAAVKYFLKRVMENITKPTSINNIFNELKSMGMKASKDSLYEWIDYACNIFLLYRVPRLTRSLLKGTASPAKYYVADIGLRNSILMVRGDDYGKALENIVYLNLRRRTGSEDMIYFYNDSKECDFIVLKNGSAEELIQACWELAPENKEREIGGLLEAAEATGCKNCKIITFDQDISLKENGININVCPIWKSGTISFP